MAQYKVPYQNLDIKVPDVGDVLRSSHGSPQVYVRSESGIQSLGVQNLGIKYLESIGAKTAPNISGDQGGYVDAKGNPITLEGGYNVSDVQKHYGFQQLKDLYGIDFESLGSPESKGYNTADFGLLGKVTELTDFNLLKSKPTGQNEIITKSISPTNPQGADVTSSIYGKTQESPSIEEVLANAGGTPEQIKEIAGATKPGVPTEISPELKKQLTPETQQIQQPAEQPGQGALDIGGGEQQVGYTGPSLVDFLGSTGQQNDFGTRAQLYQKAFGDPLGMTMNYTGTSEQNTELLNKMRGELPQEIKSFDTGGGGTGTGGGGFEEEVTEEQKNEEEATNMENNLAENYNVDTKRSDFQVNPIKAFQDVFTQIYDSFGLTDVKTMISDVNAEIKELDDKMADEITEVNENPWLSEASRSRKITSIEGKYDIKRASMTDRMQLAESLFNDGRQEAQFMAQMSMNAMYKEREFEMDELLYALKQTETQIDLIKAMSGDDDILTVTEAKALGVPYGTKKSQAYGLTPTGGDSEELTYKQKVDAEIKLANNFERYVKEARQSVRNITIIESAYDFLKEGMKTGKMYNELTGKQEKFSLNAPSQAMLVTFQKMLDPTSVVRESEYARSGEGLSLTGQIMGKFEKLRKGGAGVTATDLSEFYNMSNKLLEGYNTQMINFAQRAKVQADNYGLTIENILTPDVIDILNESQYGIGTTETGGGQNQSLIPDQTLIDEAQNAGINLDTGSSGGEDSSVLVGAIKRLFGI